MSAEKDRTCPFGHSTRGTSPSCAQCDPSPPQLHPRRPGSSLYLAVRPSPPPDGPQLRPHEPSGTRWVLVPLPKYPVDGDVLPSDETRTRKLPVRLSGVLALVAASVLALLVLPSMGQDPGVAAIANHVPDTNGVDTRTEAPEGQHERTWIDVGPRKGLGRDSIRADLLGRWKFNEQAGAVRARDTGRYGFDAVVGSLVEVGISHQGGRGYRFPDTYPGSPPARPERLVQVPDQDRLDPGVRDYVVTVRYRTTYAYGNIVQKGQATSQGGNWKLQQPGGVAQCLFRGSQGDSTVSSGRPLNDGRWHTVQCKRVNGRTTMTVDGVVTDVNRKDPGRINNVMPLSIGGKGTCDEVTVYCDYYVGSIDFVRIEGGG
jgi:hypothetical protein